ncbi:MAG: glycoside hydrolase family 95 protein [Candidatus Omnitrophota bacterium]
MNSLLWYKKPASEWKEGLPIGNGILAGMVMGGVPRERIALNHELLWRGKNRKRDVEPKYQNLKEIRRLFFAGKVLEAATLANEKLGGLGGILTAKGQRNRVDPYQPLADLFLNFGHKDVSDYRRELDLEKALVTVSYTVAHTKFRREYFVHAVHNLICIRLSVENAVGNGLLNTEISLTRSEDPECRITALTKDNQVIFTGAFPEGIKFGIKTLKIQNCRETLLFLTASVSLDGEDPIPACDKELNSIPLSWAELVESHVKEHQKFYHRVSLQIGEPNDETPTDQRLEGLRWGRNDYSIYALYFNFGRYLLLTSSSPKSKLPANLQGKWNEEIRPPWDCDLHQDINLQMNYWPAEVCNLSECTNPLFDHLERFVPHGREVSRKIYGCKGVYLPIQTDPWGRATPEARGWDVWTGAAAWLGQHFWWHYEYTLDKNFLKDRAYPFLKEVAAFYEDFLVRDQDGFLVPVPSQSPENTFVGGTSPVSLCIGATMEIELIYDVLTHAISAGRLLNVDEGKRKKWRHILKKLPPLRSGKYGQLQEWLEDYQEAEPGHRHLSHLFGFFPGDQITIDKTPKLAKAVEISLESRLAHGGGHTGWSSAWLACSFARLGKGFRALQSLHYLLSKFTTDTLLDLHPPRIFQIDGNLGGTAAIAEMLLQSHAGILRVLPALPPSWRTGKVTGLCARGGFEIDISWQEGKITEVRVFSRKGGVCRIQLPKPAKIILSSGKKTIKKTKRLSRTVFYQTAPGKRYILNAI